MANPSETLRPGWLFWAFFGLALIGLSAVLYALIQFEGVLLLARLNRWLADTFIEKLGYPGVFGLMFIESSFIPFPSEIIMPPAGDLARRLPDWSLGGVIAAGVLGSLGGALVNYYLALVLGRPILVALIRRYGKFFRLSLSGYEKAERTFTKYGEISTFTGRLIPGIRQIISLPAGLARMNLFSFCLLTSLGAGIWVVLLTLLGYWFGQNPELLAENLKLYSRWLVISAVLVAAIYGWIIHQRRRRATP